MAEVLPAQAMEEQQGNKLPAIAEGSSAGTTQPQPSSTAGDPDHVSLPDIQKRETDSSTESLIKALGLAGADEQSLGRLLKTVRGEVLSTIDELRTITTHDDNLERQYKEVVSENVQLNTALERARGEIRHLKGQLSVLQMTAPEIRKHRARLQFRERRKQEHERQLQQSRQKYLGGDLMPVLDFAERARTVNARGEYVNNRRQQQQRPRCSTYPPPPLLPPSSVPLPPLTRLQADPLPPPLLGCRCSVCKSQQSLGAVTLGSRPHPSSSSSLLSQSHSQQQHSSLHITKSGQQILLGDRVIVKGERPGVVRYIGRLETDVQAQLYVGVHLVMPVGTCDGSLRGCHYFQCPPLHGVFVKPSDVLCVTGRKPCTGGTIIPRVQERAPFDPASSRRSSSKQQTQFHWETQQEVSTPTTASLSASTMTHAHATLQEELAQANNTSVGQLFDPSVQEMSRRMETLARKNKLKLTQQQQQQQQQQQEQQQQQQQPQLQLREETTPPLPSPSPSPTEPKNQPTPTPPTPPQAPTPSPSPQAPSPSPSPQPHIPTPSPPSPEATPPPRPETPLETVLLGALRAKDLGNTGFVTGNEISATLTELSRGKAMSEQETEQLLESLGIPRAESGGFPYNDIIPYLAQAIQSDS